jgi:hypothetical protein
MYTSHSNMRIRTTRMCIIGTTIDTTADAFLLSRGGRVAENVGRQRGSWQ